MEMNGKIGQTVVDRWFVRMVDFGAVIRGASNLSTVPVVGEANNPDTRLLRRLRRRAPEAGALALILALGAYLRLAALDYGQFRGDDVNLWSIARHLALQPQILTRGLPASAAGFSNGPFQAYLLLPATLLTANPLGAYVVVALFNILSIGLFWAFVRSYWGSRLALLAALLYAVNPWAVVFSRRLLGNDLVAPFTVLLIWSLCDLVKRGRGRDSVLPLLWLAIVIQIYVGALTHLVLAGLGLAFGVRQLRARHLIGGVALFALLTAPYFLGTLVPNLAGLAFPFGSSRAPAQVDLTSTLYMFHSVSSEGYQAFANNAGRILDASSGLPRAVSWLTEAFLAIGLAVAVATVVRCLRQRTLAQAVPLILALTAILLPALLLVRHSATVYVYYMLTGFPMHFLLVALGVRAVWRALRTVLTNSGRSPGLLPHFTVAAAVVLIVGTHLLLSQAFLAAIREYWPMSDYGLPLRYTLDLSENLRALVRQQGFSRIYIAGSEDREGVLFRALQPELPSLSFLNSADTFVVPEGDAGQALYVLSNGENWIGGTFSRHFGDAAVASLDVPGYGLRYSFLALETAKLGPDTLTKLPDLAPARRYTARLGDYLALIGYDLPAEVPSGDKLRVTLYWKVLGRPPQDISLFAHLIGARGSLWGQQDGLGYPVDRWQPGDLLVQWHDIPVPVGAPPVDYTIEAGGYFRSSGQRLPVYQERGTEDRLRLGTVRLTRPAGPQRLPIAIPVEAQFGQAIRLRGYEVTTTSPAAGDHLQLTLYWESLAATAADYSVFNHLAAADGRPLAQADGPPAFGAYPTSAWQPGDLIRDVHDLVVPADIRPGRYWLLTGLYAAPNGPRLAPVGLPASLLGRLGNWLEHSTPYRAGSRVDGDHVILAAIEVQGRR